MSDTCHEAKCENNECVREVKAGASCGSGMRCSASTGACEKSCGNSVLDTGEQCDPGISDSWSCNRETCMETNLSAATPYHPCVQGTDCSSGETCGVIATATGGIFLCVPKCVGGRCSIPPGYTVRYYGLTDPGMCIDTDTADSVVCAVQCSGNADCPGGLHCGEGICSAI